MAETDGGPAVASVTWPFDNSYARLPERMFERRAPEPPPNPALIRVNRQLARALGLDPDWLESPEGVEVIAGGRVPGGAEPIALAYAGHQFGHWNPQLGDGRALLLGEVVTEHGRFDLQLKGSGRTAFSRGGDGKAPLGPVLREYVVSEAMAALGVPTSRTLAAATTGAWVLREARLPGAVLIRVATSHIRIGTFEFFDSRGDDEAVRALADHAIARHDPDLISADDRYLRFLHRVIERQARLVARWQMLGFIHGVMNTDNMLVSGDTIDYGPCAFMDAFHPMTVFSSIDHQGRYAYRNQPAIAHWNLTRLAQAMLSLLADDEADAIPLAQRAVDGYADVFVQAYRDAIAPKLGLSQVNGEADEALIKDLWKTMEDHGADFTLTFARLTELAAGEYLDRPSVAKIRDLGPEFGPWLDRWKARLAQDPTPPKTRARTMDRANPVVIPRNHRVEQAIRAAIDDQDLAPFHALVEDVTQPHHFDPDRPEPLTPPRPEEQVHQTFCGT